MESQNNMLLDFMQPPLIHTSDSNKTSSTPPWARFQGFYPFDTASQQRTRQPSKAPANQCVWPPPAAPPGLRLVMSYHRFDDTMRNSFWLMRSFTVNQPPKLPENVPKKTQKDLPTCCFSVLASTLALMVPTSPLLAFNLHSVSFKWFRQLGSWTSQHTFFHHLHFNHILQHWLSACPQHTQSNSKTHSSKRQLRILTELPFRLGSVFAGTSPLELLDLVLQIENLFLSGFQLLWRMGVQQRQWKITNRTWKKSNNDLFLINDSQIEKP